MSTPNPNERLMRFLQATPEQQAAIDRILDGKTDPEPKPRTGPLLLGMGPAAKFLGVSRGTFYRMLQAGRLSRVEILPGSFRVRREDVEAIAGGAPSMPTPSSAKRIRPCRATSSCMTAGASW